METKSLDFDRLSGAERAVAEILESGARGKINAVGMGELYARVPALENERALRRTILALRHCHGLPIGSLPGDCGGYYWIVNEDDLKRHCRHARGRALTAMLNEASVLGISLEEMFARILEEYDLADEAELKAVLNTDVARHFHKGTTSAVSQVLRIKSVKTQIKSLVRDAQAKFNKILHDLGGEDDVDATDDGGRDEQVA
jgi:hypothetical protein